ncbi:hypothetical protein MMC26_007198 [Xylographa opegraphella]|nr:hypothetical protein [Xylographa opegraphella]
MSLGRRVHYRSLSLATTYLLATPRDTSRRLFLCFSVGQAARALFCLQTAHLSTGLLRVEDTATQATPLQVQDVKEAQGGSRLHDSTLRTLSTTIPLQESTTGDKSDISVSKTYGTLPVASVVEKERHVGGFKTLEEALSAPRGKSFHNSFMLQPSNIRKIESNTNRKEAIQEFRTAITKYTGSWSYDWRLAFLELKQHYETHGTTITKPPLVIYNISTDPSKNCPIRAQDIPRPKIWSSSTFTVHVKKLAQSKVSRLMHRHLYRKQTTHTDAVHTAIMLLFEDESLRPYMTTEAFNIALSFCYKNSNISSARKLFNIMDDTQVIISTETFNVMLRGAATRNDLHSFTYLLKVMTRRGVSPNGHTWVVFLKAIKDRRAQLLVVRFMREAGMLKDAAMLRSVVRQIVEVELSDHLAGGKDLESFVSLMDSRYGTDWISIRSGNQMCYILGKNGLGSQAVIVLRVMVDRGCQPNNVTLHILLGYCRSLRQPQRAIELLRLFKSQYNVSPGQGEYDGLFMLAWRSKLINCCRVTWRVACLEAAVSYRMQKLVLHSLVRNTPEHPRTATERLFKTAGKVIVGIDIRSSPNSEKSDPGWRIKELLSQYSFTGEDRERSLSLAKQMIARDLGAMRRYKLAGNFIDLFAEALVLDRSWHNQDILQKPTTWKIQHAIHVGIDLHTKPASRPKRFRHKRFRHKRFREVLVT